MEANRENITESAPYFRSDQNTLIIGKSCSEESYAKVLAFSAICVFLMGLLNTRFLNFDDVIFATSQNWFATLSIYTSKDDRHIIGLIGYLISLLGIPYSVMRHVFMAMFAISTSGMLLSTSRCVFRSLRFGPFVVSAFCLFPFTADIFQWTCAYFIYAIGFGFVWAAIRVYDDNVSRMRLLLFAVLAGLSAMAYQPALLVPFIVVICRYLRQLINNEDVDHLRSLTSLAVAAVIAVATYFVGTWITASLWRHFFFEPHSSRLASLANVIPNLPAFAKTFLDIYLCRGPFHSLLYRSTSAMIVLGFVGTIVLAMRARGFSNRAVSVLLILILAVLVPNPMTLLGDPTVYWPSPRTALYFGIIFALLAGLIVEKLLCSRRAQILNLVLILVVLSFNCVHIYRGRLLQTKIDRRVAGEIGRALARANGFSNTAKVGIYADVSSIQQWKSAGFEVGASLFTAEYARVPLLNLVNGTSNQGFHVALSFCENYKDGIHVKNVNSQFVVCVK